VTAFYFSLIATIVSTLGLYLWAKRRPVGTSMTWGEAFVGAMFVFAYVTLIYAIVPNAWLQWCTSGLRWRSDKIGIPLGDLHYWRFGAFGHTWFHLTLLKNNRRYLWIFPVNKGCLFPTGITFFGRGKIKLNASSCQDIGAVLLYVMALGVHFKGWLWWQKRDRTKTATRELPTSAYGRPLMRKA